MTDSNIQNFLIVLLEPFTHYTYAAVAFTLLILTGAAGAIKIWRLQIVLTRELDTAINILKSNDKLTPASGDLNISNERELIFTEHFESINQKLSSLKLLGRRWEEFTETLVPPLREIDDLQYRTFRNTQRPSKYFSKAELSESMRPFISGEILIGVGLILTVLGLVAALSVAGPAFEGESGNVKAALAQLISTAGAKFLASLGGLSGSIIISLMESTAHSSVSRKVSMLCNEIELRMNMVSPERIMADQYGHMLRQTKNLEELGNSIAVAIGDRLEKTMNTMPSQLSAAIQPIASSIDSLRDTVSQTNEEGVRKLVTQFREELTDASEESMTAVVNQLESVSNMLGDTVLTLSNTNASIEQTLKESAQEAADSFHNGSQSLSQTAIDVVDKLIQGQASLEGVLEALKISSESIINSANSINNISSPLNEAASVIVPAIEKLEQTSHDTQSTLNEFSDTVNQAILENKNMLQEINQIWETQSDLFRGVDEELESAFAKIIDNTSNSLENMNTYVLKTNETMAEAINQLATIVSSLQESVEDLQETAEDLRE